MKILLKPLCVIATILSLVGIHIPAEPTNPTPVFTNENYNNTFVTYQIDPTAKTSYTIEDNTLKRDIKYITIIDIDSLSKYIDNHNKTAVKAVNSFYGLTDEKYGTEIDKDKLLYDVENNVTNIDIEDYYIKPITKDMFIAAADQKERYLNWYIAYDNEEIYQLSEDDIEIDEAANVIIKEEAISKIIDNISNSYICNRSGYEFTTINNDIVTVYGGTLGSHVDAEKEANKIRELIQDNKIEIERKPIYTEDEINLDNGYIEISISDQHVWIHLCDENNTILDSDCVTGKLDGRHNTPTGVYYISEMKNGKNLRPKGSSSPTWVNKWMKVTPDGVGLHDAYWRGAFGGNIYERNGSHGCVNLPKAFAYEIYDVVYENMPVIIYDQNENNENVE